jgi:hypothetical protein
VGVARQRGFRLALGQRFERACHLLRAVVQCGRSILQVEAQRGQHLVIAGAAEMHPRRGLRRLQRQPVLEGVVHVLLVQPDGPFAARVRLGQRRQSLLDGREVPGCQQAA